MDPSTDGLVREDYHLTLAGPARCEVKIKRSRFIGLAAPVKDEDAARTFIREQENHFHDARHVCYGWRLGCGTDLRENRSDAGEPSGTAGEPILAALRKVEVTDAVVVVIRYFGGIKLGTGGLSRAYGEAAETAVRLAETRVVLQGRIYVLDFPYPLRKTLEHLLRRAAGEIRGETYTEAVTWRVWVPNSRCAAFTDGVREATAGAVTPREASDAP